MNRSRNVAMIGLAIAGATALLLSLGHIGTRDVVFRAALAEADGNTREALKRLGPTYCDPDGNIVRLTLSRTVPSRTSRRPDHRLGNAVLRELSEYPSIKFLTIGFMTDIDDRGMRAIAKMDQLEVLILRPTRISPAGLRELPSLKNLKLLIVNDRSFSQQDALTFEQKAPGCNVVLWPQESGQHSPELINQLQEQLIEDVQQGKLVFIHHRHGH